MRHERTIVHILDDFAMGGVTRALKNFEDPRLAQLGQHVATDMRDGCPKASSANDIAIVHFTANWLKLGALAELKTLGGFSKVILIEHSYTDGFEQSEVRLQMKFRQLLRAAYFLVDTVVAVSEGQRRWILEAKLAPARKVVAIPQSRDCSSLLDISLPDRSGGPLKIGAYGRFHRQKGFDLLIEAMTKVPPAIACLILAGTGPEEPALRTKAAPIPHVEFCPPFSTPDRFLARTDVIAIPSRWEAFGLVGTEARMAGRPIIAAGIDGLTDQLSGQGFRHRCGDVDSLVSAIRSAASAEDFLRRAGTTRAEAIGEYDRMIGAWQTELSAHEVAAAA
ncbi:MAG: glycosyltransferase family 4 protein [Pseudomonadota bacterium]